MRIFNMKKSKNNCRTESDSMGKVKIPKSALYGPQTQRAIENFQVSTFQMPTEFIQSLALLKWAISSANADLNLISKEKAKAIGDAALKIADGQYSEDFPVDVFQTEL